MLELAQQLSYYLSVVDGGATSKLVGFGQQLASIGLIAQTAQAAMQSVLAPLMAIGAAGGQREQQVNNIAASLRQYEYVGQSVVAMNREIARSMPGATEAQRAAEFSRQYGLQFQEARTVARAQLQDLNRLAAILPGEANDYMEALTINQGYFGRAGVTLAETNRIVANLVGGGIGHGLRPDMVGRDLSQFLSVGPHMVDATWKQVWEPLVAGFKVRGKAVTQASIGHMNLADKMTVLRHVVEGLQPQMGAMGESWDALMGTFRSAKHEMYLEATEPIFDAFKKSVAAINSQLVRFAPYVAVVSRYFAGFVAAGLDKITAGITAFIPNMDVFGQKLQEAATRVDGFARSVYGTASGIVETVQQYIRGFLFDHNSSVRTVAVNAVSAEAGFALFGAALGGPLAVVLGGVVGRMINAGSAGIALTGNAHAIGEGARMIGSTLLSLAETLYTVYDTFVSMTATLISAGLPALLMVVGSALSVVLNICVGVFQALVEIIAAGLLLVLPWVVVPLTGLAGVLEIIWSLFSNGTTEVGGFMTKLAEASNALMLWVKDFQDSLHYLMHDWGLMSDSEYAASTARANAAPRTQPAWISDIAGLIAGMRHGPGADLNMTGRAPPAQRPHTNQDFRYSRFEITQKFAEGFDPDRVASAMASDLSSMAEQRLDTGFAPAFASPG